MANSSNGARPQDEFRNFQELAKKLIRVPKKEVDRQKAIHEKKKARTKRSTR